MFQGMPDFATTLLVALGLVFVIEGLLYALFPDAMKKGIALLLTLPESYVQRAGLVAVALGVGLIWLVIG